MFNSFKSERKATQPQFAIVCLMISVTVLKSVLINLLWRHCQLFFFSFFFWII